MILSGAKVSDQVQLELGDEVFFGGDVSIVGKGRLKIGDYTKIHRGTLIVCHSSITIGHNCWIGERSILDATGELTLGNNVGVGMGSSIYTHISFGDVFSGCRLRNSKNVLIDDEAWIVGQVTVQASNVAKRVVIMPMSNVVSDIETTNTVWSGNPAVDVTHRYGLPWEETTVEFRTRRFGLLVKNFARERNEKTDWISCVDQIPAQQDLSMTYFAMCSRTYTKRGSSSEREFMRWLLQHNKAKFTPEENK